MMHPTPTYHQLIQCSWLIGFGMGVLVVPAACAIAYLIGRIV